MGREDYLLHAVRLQDLDEEFAVVLLLQFEVLLLVFGVGKVFGKLLDFFGQELQATQVWLVLLRDWLYSFLVWINRLPIRTVLYSSFFSLKSSLFCVVVLLKVFLGHFALYDHQACVNKRFLEKLTLKHPNQVLNANVFPRWTFDDASVGSNLLLCRESCLRVSHTLLSECLLMLLKELY